MTTAFANVVAVSAHWLVVVAVGAAALGLLRVHAAAARLAVFRAMVIVALALPLVPIPYQPSREPTPIAPVRPSGVASPSGGVVSPSTHTISVDATREAVQQGTLSVLAAGALLRLLWLAAGLLRLRRWQAAGEPTDDAALRQATQLLGVAAEFRSSQDVDGPVTFGWRRPIVLLPRSVRLLSDAERTAIACHELVHVARHHWLETLLVEALRSVSWFHPATWWWHDQWRLARERTVDRAAVELLRDRRIYVDALLSLATVSPHRAAPAVAMFARRPQLVRRVNALLEEASMSHRRIVVSTAGVVAVASVSAVAAGIAVPVTLRNPVALSRSEARSSAPSSVQPSRPLAPRIESAVLPASVAIDALPPPETRVIVDARIDESGTVTEATVVQGAPVLAASATNAVEQWRFRPGGPDRATIGFNFASDYSDPGAPAPVRVGGAVAPPSKLRDTRPVYPEKAQQDKVQGVVICETTIGADGKVEYAMVIRSIPALDEAALDAILQWEFTPTLVDGVPHAVVMVITVNFTLAA